MDDIIKELATVEKRRISGQKGGAPIGNSNATKTSKTNKTSKKLKTKGELCRNILMMIISAAKKLTI
jgi:hypothetical protein